MTDRISKLELINYDTSTLKFLSSPFWVLYDLIRGPGTMVLFISWCMTLNTMWQMIQLHECVSGTRFDRYIDLGRYAFGEKLGPWIVLPQQLIVQIGCDIVYMVTGKILNINLDKNVSLTTYKKKLLIKVSTCFWNYRRKVHEEVHGNGLCELL